MRKPENPCEDCTKRTETCHMECPFYPEWKEEIRIYNEFIKSQKESDEQRIKYNQTRMSKMRRKLRS